MRYFKIIGTGTKLYADVETFSEEDRLYLYYEFYILWIRVSKYTRIIEV